MMFLGFLLCFISGELIQAYEGLMASKLQLNGQSRISGGNPAGVNEFPWHVYILANGETRVSTCGGSVLSETWVLTAAHCTRNYLSLDLYFGAIDVYAMSVIRSSTYWVEHSEYDPDYYNNDISVVQLDRSIKYSPNIQPITLLAESQLPNEFVNEVAIVLGFGYTSDENPQESSVLLYTEVLIVPNSNCTKHYDANIVTERTMCAVGHNSPSHSICSGDSGGAMVLKNENGNYIQIGINSFVAETGCTAGLPSGYVRISSFLTWISDETGVNVKINPANTRFRLNRIMDVRS